MKPSPEEIENWKKYHIPAHSEIYRIKRNAIFINNHNTIHHELFKSLAAIVIHRFGDIKITKDLIESVKSLSKLIELIMKDFEKDHVSFITECVPNEDPDRRIDLVNLKSNTRYEFERDVKNKKEDCVTINI